MQTSVVNIAIMETVEQKSTNLSVISVYEASDRLGICPRTFRKLLKNQRIKAVRTSPNGKWLITESSIEEYLKSNQ